MKPWEFFLPVVLLSVLAASTTMAQMTIVDVRRNITLADDDVVYKDFYISGGEGDGLKKNLVVTAVRKMQIRDANGSNSYGEIEIPVGQIRIVGTYGKVSVAREYKLLSRDELPMLEQTGLMVGDKIDLKGSFVDNAKPVYKKKKVAEASKPAPTNATTVVVTTAVAATTAAAPPPAGPAPASVTPPTPAVLEKTAEAAVTKAQ